MAVPARLGKSKDRSNGQNYVSDVQKVARIQRFVVVVVVVVVGMEERPQRQW